MNVATALGYEQFDSVPNEDGDACIRTAKEKFGRRLVIRGRRCQRSEVYRHADFTGDSLKLTRLDLTADSRYKMQDSREIRRVLLVS